MAIFCSVLWDTESSHNISVNQCQKYGKIQKKLNKPYQIQWWPKEYGKSMQTAVSLHDTMEQHNHHLRLQLIDLSQAILVSGPSNLQGQQWKAKVLINMSSHFSDYKYSSGTYIMNINWARRHNSAMVKYIYIEKLIIESKCDNK